MEQALKLNAEELETIEAIASAPSPENVAVEPVADLIARLTYRVNNPSAWDAFDDGASELIREAASSIASLSERLAEVEQERDAALDRVDELERNAGDVAAEFENELTAAVWALLRRLDADMADGFTAQAAIDWLDTHIGAITQDADKLRAKLAEAREIIEPFAKIASEYSPREDDDFNIMADKDVLGEKLTLRKFRRARAFRDATPTARCSPENIAALLDALESERSRADRLEKTLTRIAEHPDTVNGSFRASIARAALGKEDVSD